jgi:hypothetical protein
MAVMSPLLKTLAMVWMEVIAALLLPVETHHPLQDNTDR